MKSILMLSFLLVASISQAAIQCPGKLQTLQKCDSTPSSGDSPLAARVFDSIMICGTADKGTTAVIEKDGSHQTLKAQTSKRQGQNSYTMKSKGVVFTLALPTEKVDKKKRQGSLTVSLKEVGILKSATYTCKN